MIVDISKDWIRAADAHTLIGCRSLNTARVWMAENGVKIYVFGRRAQLVKRADIEAALAKAGGYRPGTLSYRSSVRCA